MKTIMLCLLFSAACLCYAGEDTNIIAESEWSAPVQTGDVGSLRARLVITYAHDLASASPGEEALVYLELQNVTGGWKSLQIYFQPAKSLHLTLLDANGKPPVNRGGDRGDGGMITGDGGYWITIPYDSTIKIRLNMSGSEKGSSIGLSLWMPEFVHWHIPAGDTNTYFISGTISLTPPTNQTSQDVGVSRDRWNGTLELPKMKIALLKP